MFAPATHTVRLIGVQPLAMAQLKQALHHHIQYAQAQAPSKPAGLVLTVETVSHPRELDAHNPTDSTYTTIVLGLTAPTPHEVLADTALRAMLGKTASGFSVVYGRDTQQQLQQIWGILRQKGVIAAPLAQPNDQPDTTNTQHHAPIWSCDACSDPACEYRLFSRFLQTEQNK